MLLLSIPYACYACGFLPHIKSIIIIIIMPFKERMERNASIQFNLHFNLK